MTRARPSPYMAITAPTNSAARPRARGSANRSSSAWSSETRATRSSGTPSLVMSGEPGGSVDHLSHLAGARVHEHAARQARIEAAHGAHDVDALEVVRAVLLEDRRVLDGVLVRAGGTEGVPRAGVPRRRWVRLVVRDLAVADHHVVRQHPAGRLVEAAADGLLGHLELAPRLRPSRPHLLQRALQAVQPHQRRVGLVV